MEPNSRTPDWKSTQSVIQLRISDGDRITHKLFQSARLALRTAETYCEAGYDVVMLSSMGRVLMHFEPRNRRSWG
jgi:hypothetical protein